DRLVPDFDLGAWRAVVDIDEVVGHFAPGWRGTLSTISGPARTRHLEDVGARHRVQLADIYHLTAGDRQSDRRIVAIAGVAGQVGVAGGLRRLEGGGCRRARPT